MLAVSPLSSEGDDTTRLLLLVARRRKPPMLDVSELLDCTEARDDCT